MMFSISKYTSNNDSYNPPRAPRSPERDLMQSAIFFEKSACGWIEWAESLELVSNNYITSLSRLVCFRYLILLIFEWCCHYGGVFWLIMKMWRLSKFRANVVPKMTDEVMSTIFRPIGTLRKFASYYWSIGRLYSHLRCTVHCTVLY